MSPAELVRDTFPPLSRSHTVGDNEMGSSKAVHTSNPFSRLEPSHSIRNRASTLQNETSSEFMVTKTVAPPKQNKGGAVSGSIFEGMSSNSNLDTTATGLASSSMAPVVPEKFDELPIEILSLIDRCGFQMKYDETC